MRRSLYQSLVLKKELSQKAKLLIYPVGSPSTYGQELMVVTKRGRSWIQAAKLSVLHSVAGCTVRGRVRSSVTPEESGEEQLVQVCPGGRRPSRTRWRASVCGRLLSSAVEMFNF